MRILIFLLILGITSCTLNNSEIIIIDEIDGFPDSYENKILARNLLSYEYSKLFFETTGIRNEVLKGNVSYNYQLRKSDKKIEFILELKNGAIEYKDTLVSFFKSVVTEKKRLHIKKQKEFNECLQWSNKFIKWAEREEYNKIKKSLSSLLNNVDMKAMIPILKERNLVLKKSGKRTLVHQQIYFKIQEYTGEFYVILYEYENGSIEQLTMQYFNNEVKLLGYDYRTNLTRL
ncbi:MAG: hypothetical protein HRT73_07515 [Flavobacteriales bacterium]|nr:hypothetical protein [Flavobacteriales bacterium]